MEISMVQMLKLFRKKFLPILLSALLCAAAAYGISKYVVPKTYVSTVKLYVYTPESNPDPTMNINALDYAQKIVNTYIEMLQTRSFYQKVMERSGIKDTVDHFEKTIEFSPMNQTEVFQAKVSAHTPGDAKKIADSITALAPSTIGSLKKNSTLEVVDPAVIPEKPSFPNSVLLSALGFVLGAAGCVFFLFLHSFFNIKIRSDNLAGNLDLPILAAIPAFHEKL
ncbi:Chain length determinant protein [Caprobacter fermentans]|uniref:Chain length determinant protein n=1 Tax=Caproicibacter fermentans TaxID=2576756 RepID=A0A6N8HZ21_9FIRM|nr:Wzz/FepE/Etk N-terminal domain-containing protein [Caproicibacter fermentans]MVB10727.1 Chain length determinant protein [Caproicibacter fermentans]